MKPYNGHRSWNAWNVSLWIDNDEGLYNFALDCLKRGKQDAGKAARLFMRDFAGDKTPDGAVYNHLSVKLALAGLQE
ncbi:MAG: hypothetical protein WC742_15420 [Gallionellaceae bacterium]|jgi:hypothetical protein